MRGMRALDTEEMEVLAGLGTAGEGGTGIELASGVGGKYPGVDGDASPGRNGNLDVDGKRDVRGGCGGIDSLGTTGAHVSDIRSSPVGNMTPPASGV